jgi:hypothetical protein
LLPYLREIRLPQLKCFLKTQQRSGRAAYHATSSFHLEA